MRHSKWVLSLALVTLAAGTAWAQMGMMGGPGMGGGGMGGPGMMAGGPGGGGPSSVSMARHRFAMRGGLGPEYANQTNPLPATPKVLEEGKAVYTRTCAVCHGAAGQGDGPAGKGLNPPAANIAFFVHRPFASDGYLDWTLSEGGKQFGSAMPAYKGTLEQEQIWAVIRYLRTL